MEQVTVTNVSCDFLISQIKAAVFIAVNELKQKEAGEKLLTAVETCKVFVPAIAKSTLHEWTTQGLIPVHRIGGRIFYKQSEIIEAAKRITKYSRDKTPA